MSQIENKRTKRLRITLCIMFLLNIVCLSLPYSHEQTAGGYVSATGLELFLTLFIEGDARYNMMGAASSLLLILPLAGFLVAAFDKHRQVKSIVGFLVSVAGVIAITFMINRYISVGAMFALLLYIASCFISAMLALTTAAVRHEEEKKQDK